ncbi:MFS transporter [Campylobacter jejuni]
MEKSLLFHFRRIGVEFIIFSVYAVFSISWAATGSLMPLISNDLALNTQQATLITSMIVVAKIFGAYLGLFFKRKNISFKIMLLSGGACIFICGFWYVVFTKFSIDTDFCCVIRHFLFYVVSIFL